MASMAQAESESISKNVQMGVKFHYQQGKVCAGHENMIGFRRTSDGRLEIISEEAEVVRQIYRDFLDGMSPGHIAERLNARYQFSVGMDETDASTGDTDESQKPSRLSSRRWNLSSVKYVLKNEKYMGDLLLQKYYSADVLKKKMKPNTGEREQFYVENAHPPIVPKEIYYQAQAELARRKASPHHYLHSLPFSGKVFCGDCGTPLIRMAGQKGRRTYFRCGSKVKKEYRGVKCENGGIAEEDLFTAVEAAFEEIRAERDDLIRLQERLLWGPIREIDRLLEDGENEELMQKKAELMGRITSIRGLIKSEKEAKEYGAACCDVDEFFERTATERSLDEQIACFVEKVVVGEETVEVWFKAGVKIVSVKATGALSAGQ